MLVISTYDTTAREVYWIPHPCSKGQSMPGSSLTKGFHWCIAMCVA